MGNCLPGKFRPASSKSNFPNTTSFIIWQVRLICRKNGSHPPSLLHSCTSFFDVIPSLSSSSNMLLRRVEKRRSSRKSNIKRWIFPSHFVRKSNLSSVIVKIALCYREWVRTVSSSTITGPGGCKSRRVCNIRWGSFRRKTRQRGCPSLAFEGEQKEEEAAWLIFYWALSCDWILFRSSFQGMVRIIKIEGD